MFTKGVVILSSKPFLFHGQTKQWVTQQDDTLVIRLLCHDPEHLITSHFIRCEPDNEDRLIALELIQNDFHLGDDVNSEGYGEEDGKLDGNTYRLYQASIPISTHIDNTYYAFKCLTEKGQIWLTAAGQFERIPGRETHFKFNTQDRPPEWIKEQVFYQIFPDRFCQGNADISVKTGEYLYRGGENAIIAKQWGEPVASAGHQSTGASEFYGGDLQGIQNKLGYLQELGISALYLNPIFTSPSNHKYDTTDYLNIDPHFGDNADFAKLSYDIHQRDMKIMLDAVFNHTSCEHPWFGRYQHFKDSAYQHPDSPYRDYYVFLGEPNSKEDYYFAWKGVDNLPKLNFLNEQVQNYIYKAESSVVKHWLKAPYHIDGWRFDVIHMLGEGTNAYNNAHYVRAFRESAKAVNPEAYIVGEHFYEATQWLQGDQEDGAMNYYGFAHPVRAFFAGLDIAYHRVEIDAQAFDNWLTESRAKIPWLNQLAQLNQLDSHDTSRFINQLNGDLNRLKAASMMLFSYPGTPCLYYGTEVALQGGNDPDNRRCFPWGDLDKNSDIFTFYQRLINLRKSRIELQQGCYHTLYAQDKSFVFARFEQGKTSIYAINLGQKSVSFTFERFELMTNAQYFSGFDNHSEDWHLEAQQQLSFTLPAECALLLASEEG